MSIRLYVAVAWCALIPSVAFSQPARTTSRKKGAKQSKPIIISSRRTYRLEVGKIDDQILLNLERRWVFSKAIPKGLLDAIRKHPQRKAIKPDASKGKAKADESGYIRWQPDKKSTFQAGGLLWYVNGRKRKELVIGIDAVLQSKPAKGEAKARFAFAGLDVTANLSTGQLLSLAFAKAKLPGKSGSVKVVDTMETSVAGELSKESSNAVRAANGLLADALHQSFRRTAFSTLANESHHGITLGWLGHERLRHNLMLIPGGEKANYAIRYRVIGTPFPVRLVRRQIGPTGWPMVLSGHEYVGSTQNGRSIFRRVEYHLSRPESKAKSKKP